MTLASIDNRNASAGWINYLPLMPSGITWSGKESGRERRQSNPEYLAGNFFSDQKKFTHNLFEG